MNYPTPQKTNLVNSQKYQCVPNYPPLNIIVKNRSIDEIFEQLSTPIKYEINQNYKLVQYLIDPKPITFTFYVKKTSVFKNITRFFKLFFTKIIIFTLK